MPVEPGIVDTNVLVYALDADATQHASSSALLEAGRAASVTLYVTSQFADPRDHERERHSAHLHVQHR